MSDRIGSKDLRTSMLADIRFALTSKSIFAILFLSFVTRVLINILVLPTSPSAFGPDEGTYASLCRHVSKGLPVSEFAGDTSRLYNSSKSLVWPCALLVQLGTEELSAVRYVASIYGLLSSLALILCYIAYQNLVTNSVLSHEKLFGRRFLILLLIFSFFPSNYLWSVIGLRESASQFWLIASLYFLLKLLRCGGVKSLKFFILLILAFGFSYASRPQTALVFSSVALCIYMVVMFRHKIYLPFSAIVLGIIAGQLFTATPSVSSDESFRAKISDKVESEYSENVEEVNDSCSRDGETIILNGKKYVCEKNETKIVIERNLTANVVQYLLSVGGILSRSQNPGPVAQSALPVSTCKNFSLVELISCHIPYIVKRFISFLFRPALVFDQGSATLNFAAVENVGWLTLTVLSIATALRRRKNFLERLVNFNLIAYVIIFAFSAGIYETNLGTAFRHKSAILWPLVFILMVSPKFFPIRQSKF